MKVKATPTKEAAKKAVVETAVMMVMTMKGTETTTTATMTVIVTLLKKRRKKNKKKKIRSKNKNRNMKRKKKNKLTTSELSSKETQKTSLQVAMMKTFTQTKKSKKVKT